jgi:hypothetical protein
MTNFDLGQIKNLTAKNDEREHQMIVLCLFNISSSVLE